MRVSPQQEGTLNLYTLKTYYLFAGKRRKLKQDEIDAEMQQEEQTTSSNRTAMPPIQMQNQHRDSDVGSANLSDEPSAVASPSSKGELPSAAAAT